MASVSYFCCDVLEVVFYLVLEVCVQRETLVKALALLPLGKILVLHLYEIQKSRSFIVQLIMFF